MEKELEQSNQPDHGEGSMREFFDALTSYAIDPTRWVELLAQLDRLSESLDRWDPGRLVAELSRAESLSWRIKQDGNPGQTGFAYLLLDDQGRAAGSSENLRTLVDYLSVNEDGAIHLADPASKTSLEAARINLSAARGHSLVSLSRADRPGHRFGFLIARDQFPASLERVANDAELALFIAQDDGSDRLHNVVQASFGLTAAEAEVTMTLAHGLTLKEASADLEISINTARNHLQSVFDKSGINRQSDLLLVVTQLSVILAATAESAGRSRRVHPSPPRNFFILPDGRRLAYRTYGVPTGRPAVYLHETLGCSRLPPATDDLAREHGLYLVAPERPGFGFSDVDPEYSFPSVCSDLLSLLDHLQIQRCTLIGFLSGGAYALWFANTHPGRAERLVLVAGRPPTPMQGRFKHLMPLYNKMIAQPWLMSSFFNILRNRSSPETNARLINSVYGAVTHDRAYLSAHPDMFDHMVAYTVESLTVTAAGVASELKCFARAPAVTLDRLQLPISAWHGMEDRLSLPDELEQYLRGVEVSWKRIERAGSLIVLEHWASIVRDAAALARAERGLKQG